MKDFFEEYGWTAITCVGGFIGVMLLLSLCWGKDSMLAGVVNIYLGTVMK